MRTIKFPKMFASNSTRVWKSKEHREQTKQSATLLLQSERGELFSDPYYGLLIKHYMFSQNDSVLKDVIIDLIYEQVAIFLPQIKIKRSDITIYQNKEKGVLYCEFTGINQIDYQPNTYNLVLYKENN